MRDTGIAPIEGGRGAGRGAAYVVAGEDDLDAAPEAVLLDLLPDKVVEVLRQRRHELGAGTAEGVTESGGPRLGNGHEAEHRLRKDISE